MERRSHWVAGVVCALATIGVVSCAVDPGAPNGSAEQAWASDDNVIKGMKYYDTNGNGQYDFNEPPIPNWPIRYTDPNGVTHTVLTDSTGQFVITNAIPGTYTIWEVLPVAPTPWVQTGNTVYQCYASGNATCALNADKTYTITMPVPVALPDGGVLAGHVEHVKFGNMCTGSESGRTPGFWSNRNGQALITGTDLSMLVQLNLRNADGSNYDPTSKTDLATWLLNGTATNMAYMLSVQLTAMELNVAHSFLPGTLMIYAPGTNSADSTGYATINAIMTEANTALGADGITTAGDPNRAYQEALKNALDAANNNTWTFPQTSATSCPAPVFPSS